MDSNTNSVLNDLIDSELPVLIVDDVFAARRVLIRLLMQIGFKNVKEATTGSEALEKAKEDLPLLIICDLHLADMSGTDVFFALRQDSSLEDTPFVMITSDASKNEFNDAGCAGITTYLLKPFNAETLKKAIIEAVGE